ncbi:MAG: CinA family protein [Pseudomonadota bacterium]
MTTGLARAVLERCRRHGWRLATAESCTGGLIAARLTDLAGSSDVVLGGIVAYHNDIKHRLLGVPLAMLEAHGAVSEPVARAMAEGCVRALDADVAVAVTGIAGPGGGTPTKPVGLVHLAVWCRGTSPAHVRAVFPGNRAQVRAATVNAALDLVLQAVPASAA